LDNQYLNRKENKDLNCSLSQTSPENKKSAHGPLLHRAPSHQAAPLAWAGKRLSHLGCAMIQ
jgi:hypothetical protein